jgi:hypothetical protein
MYKFQSSSTEFDPEEKMKEWEFSIERFPDSNLLKYVHVQFSIREYEKQFLMGILVRLKCSRDHFGSGPIEKHKIGRDDVCIDVFLKMHWHWPRSHEPELPIEISGIEGFNFVDNPAPSSHV